MWQKKWIIGNWKMNGCLNSNQQIINEINKFNQLDKIKMGIAAPTIYLHNTRHLLHPEVLCGAQNNSQFAKQGAYTGEVCAAMLSDCGVDFCLVGHSERRLYFLEDERILRLKIENLLQQNIIPILCVGETEEQRKNQQQEQVIEQQLSVLKQLPMKHICIAYEPVWAIGSGQVASVAQISEMHNFIVAQILSAHGKDVSIRSLYGGSVNDKNAQEILAIPHVDGALIGGASLKSDTFLQIAKTASTGY